MGVTIWQTVLKKGDEGNIVHEREGQDRRIQEELCSIDGRRKAGRNQNQVMN